MQSERHAKWHPLEEDCRHPQYGLGLKPRLVLGPSFLVPNLRDFLVGQSGELVAELVEGCGLAVESTFYLLLDHS